MDITSLRSGLWGYKKSDVCEYIAKINEDFSRKLLEALQEQERTVQELTQKIERLEEENAAFREERDYVTTALTDAKAFAADLRAKATAENDRLRADNLAYNQQEQKRIDACSSGIDSIRSEIRRLLCRIDDDLSGQSAALCEQQTHLQALEDATEKGES